MAVEYKPSTASVQWWVFDLPGGCPTVSAESSERRGTSTVEAIATVWGSLLVKFSRDHNSTNAKAALETFFRRTGLSGLGAHLPLDRAHLQSWGFYNTKQEARAEDLAAEVLESSEEELREEQEIFTGLEAEAKQQAAEAEAAGNASEAAKWTQEAARYTERLSVISLKLRHLAPQACLTTGPAETQEQSLEAFDAQATARQEELTQRIAMEGRMGIFEWLYGRERVDVITCYIKPGSAAPLHSEQERKPDALGVCKAVHGVERQRALPTTWMQGLRYVQEAPQGPRRLLRLQRLAGGCAECIQDRLLCFLKLRRLWKACGLRQAALLQAVRGERL